MNTSATGGYLTPSAPPPSEDDELDDILHDVFAGITGLEPELVRPRFQPEPVDLPDIGKNWLAFGIVDETPDANAVVIHDPLGDGSDRLQRQIAFEILCSFYGPNAQAYAGILVDGFQIAQNRDGLKAAGLNFTSTEKVIQVSELVKERWLSRFDVPVSLTRQVNRTYPVQNLLLGQGVIRVDLELETDEPMVVPISVRPK